MIVIVCGILLQHSSSTRSDMDSPDTYNTGDACSPVFRNGQLQAGSGGGLLLMGARHEQALRDSRCFKTECRA